MASAPNLDRFPTEPYRAYPYGGDVPPTARDDDRTGEAHPGAFDHYALGLVNKDTILVFPFSYSDDPKDDSGYDVRDDYGGYDDEDEEEGPLWKRTRSWKGILNAVRKYEMLSGEGSSSRRLVGYKGPEPYGYLLERLHPGPLDPFLTLHHRTISVSNPTCLSLLLRWSFNILSALSVLHASHITHNELCPQTIWLRSDLSAALVGLWGAFGPDDDLEFDEPDYITTNLIHYKGPKGSKSDMFDWATVVWQLMNDGQPPLMDIHFQHGPAAVLRAAERGEFPDLEEERLGDFVNRAWRGMYENVDDLARDVQSWLEARGYQVEDGDILGLDLNWLAWSLPHEGS